MALLSWSDQYLIGNEVIDSEHQELFRLINDFHTHWLAARDRRAITKVLNQLIVYAQSHFRHEEAIMKDADFAQFAEHQQIHEALIDSIFALQKSYEDGSLRLEMDTMKFVKSWLLTHILENDYRFRDFLTTRARRQPAVEAISEKDLSAAGITFVSSTELYPELRQPGLPMLVVDNALGRAVIALQGAHVMAYQAAGQREMLWVSPQCVLEAGRPIRGGIPLCLPWFGPGPDGKTLHGFARLMPWTVVAAKALDNGATQLAFELVGDASISEMWPHAFAFRLELTVGSELALALSAQNRGGDAAPLAFAFHSYFAVPDVAQASVSGLSGLTYIDKMDHFARKTQAGNVTIDAVTDSIYLDPPARQTITSTAGRIGIESASRCALVWNAWTNDKNMVDLGEGNHVGYLCVERGDFADYAVTLPPGGKYSCSMTLSY